jgi:hypothetical protein
VFQCNSKALGELGLELGYKLGSSIRDNVVRTSIETVYASYKGVCKFCSCKSCNRYKVSYLSKSANNYEQVFVTSPIPGGF